VAAVATVGKLPERYLKEGVRFFEHLFF